MKINRHVGNALMKSCTSNPNSRRNILYSPACKASIQSSRGVVWSPPQTTARATSSDRRAVHEKQTPVYLNCKLVGPICVGLALTSHSFGIVEFVSRAALMFETVLLISICRLRQLGVSETLERPDPGCSTFAGAAAEGGLRPRWPVGAHQGQGPRHGHRSSPGAVARARSNNLCNRASV